MVYCDGVEVESKLGRLIQAFRCDRPSEWQMDEFIQMAEDMHKEITRLRESEKDAARYRWLRDAPATSASEPIRHWMWSRPYGTNMKYLDDAIDQAMKEKGDE